MEKILGRRWFSGRSTVGAVLVEVNGLQCAYIGVAAGVEEEHDIKDIRSFGARLPFDIAHAMFPSLDELTYADEAI